MATLLSDSFAGVAGTLLQDHLPETGGQWVYGWLSDLPPETGNMELTGDGRAQKRPYWGGPAIYYNAAACPQGDYDYSLTCSWTYEGTYSGPCWRVDPVARTFFNIGYFNMSASDGRLRLNYYDGTYFLIQEDYILPFTDGRPINLTIKERGNTFEVWLDSVTTGPIFTRTTTDSSSGRQFGFCDRGWGGNAFFSNPLVTYTASGGPTGTSYEVTGNGGAIAGGQAVISTGTNTAPVGAKYVDYVGGSDTNPGTKDLPWKHCPGDASATGNAAAYTPQPGDAIIFKGGVTYAFAAGGGDKYISVTASGTPGNPITYISGHLYGWPDTTSRAVIDGANSSNTVGNFGVIGIIGKSYVTFKGLEMIHQPVKDDLGFIGMKNASPTAVWSNITIDACVIHFTNGNAVRANGAWDITSTPPNHLTVKNCSFYDSWSHLLFLAWGIDSVLIENNYFDMHGSDPYGAGSPLANAINMSYTNAPWTTQPITNTTIRGNDFNQSLTNSEKSQILLQHNIQNLLIENNTFRGTPRVSCIDQVGPLKNYTLRNNVFRANPRTFEGICRFWTDQGDGIYCDGIKIYNNTFVATPALGAVLYFVRGDNTTNRDGSVNGNVYRNVDIRNNIIDTNSNTKGLVHIGADSGGGPVVQLSTFTCDYNAYNAGTNASPFAYLGVACSFASWKTQSGKDAHSVVGAVAFTDRAGANFTLQTSDTVALNKGVDLTSTGFSTDKIGKNRTQGSAWDIGAYESSTSFTLPANRAVTWKGNVGLKDPSTTTRAAFVTLTPSGSDDSGMIQAQINACPVGKAVVLGAGTFRIDAQIKGKTGVTLRGQGKGKTILSGTTTLGANGSAQGRFILVQPPSWSWDYSSPAAVDLQAPFNQGQVILNTKTAHGLSVGSLIRIDQQGNLAADPPVGPNNSGFTVGRLPADGKERYMGQVCLVTAVPSATSIQIEVPLYATYTDSLVPQIVNLTGQMSQFGIEDLTIDNSVSGMQETLIEYCNAQNCWIYNVDFICSYKSMVKFYGCYRMEVRGCTFHDPYPVSVGNTDSDSFVPNRSYGVWMWHCSASLVENNEFYHLMLAGTMNGATSGNVWGYNYVHNMHSALNSPPSSIGCHGAHPHMNLLEGNLCDCYLMLDNYWGSSSQTVAYRNRFMVSSYRAYTMQVYDIYIQKNATYSSFVGNVLGNSGVEAVYQSTPDSWNVRACFGFDDDAANSKATALIHANWVSRMPSGAAGGVQYDPLQSTDLPASLYLTSKPSWMGGSVPWPPIGPDVSPMYPTATVAPFDAGGTTPTTFNLIAVGGAVAGGTGAAGAAVTTSYSIVATGGAVGGGAALTTIEGDIYIKSKGIWREVKLYQLISTIPQDPGLVTAMTAADGELIGAYVANDTLEWQVMAEQSSGQPGTIVAQTGETLQPVVVLGDEGAKYVEWRVVS